MTVPLRFWNVRSGDAEQHVQLTVMAHGAGWSSDAADADADADAVQLGPFHGSVVGYDIQNRLCGIQHSGQLSPYLGSKQQRTHEVVLAMEGQLCGLLSQLEPCLPADGFDKLEARLQARLRPLRRLAPGDGRLDALKLDYGYVQRAVARQQPVLKVTAALRTLLVTAHGVLLET
jgi:hypothetical protein